MEHLVADLTGSSKRSVRPHVRTRQSVIGHIAQASWHLQLALAYCPDTSESRTNIDDAVRLMNVLSKPLGGLFKFVHAYCQDDNATCNFIPELHLALLHLRMALETGTKANLRHGKMPESPELIVRHRNPSWPVLYRSLCAIIARLESAVATLKMLKADAKGYNRRVKKRSTIAHQKQLVQAVRRAERAFRACQAASG